MEKSPDKRAEYRRRPQENGQGYRTAMNWNMASDRILTGSLIARKVANTVTMAFGACCISDWFKPSSVDAFNKSSQFSLSERIAQICLTHRAPV